MNKRRLLKLADLLEADAKNKKGIKFNMSDWGVMDDPDNPVSCGTEACAMGLAALSGAFRKAGLNYYRGERAVYFKWKGRDIDGIDAAQKLFELEHEDAWNFFIPGDHPRTGAAAERHLAKRIRKFVAADR